MPVKISTLSEKELRTIGDAFGNYKYDDSERGMSYLCKSSQATSDYICAYAQMMIRENALYSTSDAHEAFIGFRSSKQKIKTSSSMGLLKSILCTFDFGHALKMLKGSKGAGKSYKSILSKRKIPYLYVDLVAVREEYQGKGFMRPLLEIAFEEGRRLAVPVVLDTDAELKKAKYEHLGMRCVTTTQFLEGVKLYGLVYEPENIPKEWKSEAVLGSDAPKQR